MPPEPRQATLTDIAARAGVSVSTVSKVLNGRTDVAPATRGRIGRLLSEHGYRTGRRTGLADLVIDGLHSPWADELLAGAVDAAAEADCAIVVNRVRSPEEFAAVIDRIVARGTDGVLTVLHLPRGPVLERLAAQGVPLVVVDPAEEPGDGVRSVGATHWYGALTATRHLLDLGHRRIAAITGPGENWSVRVRLDGYRAALAQAGVPVAEGLVRADRFTPAGGRRQALDLLALREPPSAVVAGNDAQAFGVLQALAERGVRAPQDMSVVGFDDVPVAEWATPALTTVRQPLAAMAATAFRMLRLSTESGAAQPDQVELATTLVIRASTAAAPARPE
jgi:DNA-binding LacI/PurR family transcriptional regulator